MIGKKGAVPILVIIVLGLILLNIVGIATLTSKLSKSPLLIVAIFVGLYLLIKKNKGGKK